MLASQGLLFFAGSAVICFAQAALSKHFCLALWAMMCLSLLFCFKLVLIQLYFRFCIALDNHSMDSSNPSPFIALALKIWNVRFFKASSPNALWTSVTDMAPSMSCLLANTTNIAPFNSSSWKIKIKWKNCQNDRTSTLYRLKINKVPRFFPDICL